jgi:hypothetical protein
MKRWREVSYDRRRLIVAVAVAGFLLWLAPGNVAAISSSNYQVQEDFVGGGGSVNSTSTNYKSQDSLGAPAVGDGASATKRTQSGTTTTNDPTLTFAVNTTAVSLGALSTSLVKTGTATFSVRNYTSYGYIVQIVGNTPSNGSHNLNNMSSPAASAVGTEQFGINLKANTAPTTFGAEAQQLPDVTASFGVAASGYNTANVYKYVSGNTIASAPKSSGQTSYTISYIANIANSTQNGSYSGNQTLVCTGTY